MPEIKCGICGSVNFTVEHYNAGTGPCGTLVTFRGTCSNGHTVIFEYYQKGEKVRLNAE